MHYKKAIIKILIFFIFLLAKACKCPHSGDKAASPVSMGRTSPTSEQGVQAGSPAAPLEHQPQRYILSILP